MTHGGFTKMKMFFFFFLISLSACNPKSPESKTNDASKTASLAENKSEKLPSALEPKDYDISTTDLGSGNVGASVAFRDPEQYASYVVGIGEENYEVCGASTTFDCTQLENYTSISLSACNNEGCGPSVPKTLSCPNVQNTSEELPPIATILEADQMLLSLARSFKSEVTNLINSQELTKDAKALLEPIVAKADCDIVADFDTILALITEEEKLSTEAIIGIAVGVTAIALTGAIVGGVMLYKRAVKPPTPAVELQNTVDKAANEAKETKPIDASTTNKTLEAKNKARVVFQAITAFNGLKITSAAKKTKTVADAKTATDLVLREKAATKIQDLYGGKKVRRLLAKKTAISNFIKNLSWDKLTEIEKLLKERSPKLFDSLRALDQGAKIFDFGYYNKTKNNLNTRTVLNSFTRAQIDQEATTRMNKSVNNSTAMVIWQEQPINNKSSAIAKMFLTQTEPSAFDSFKEYCVALVQEVAELKLLIDTESIKLASGEEIE